MPHPPLEPITLAGDHVLLVPLAPEHVDPLVAAATGDRATFGWTNVPRDRVAMERYVGGLLAEHAAGAALPFVQVSGATGEVLGCTRYMELRWVAGRALPDEVEIGGTWLVPAAQRTGVNTEAKLLLLRYAFEELGVWRVQICTATHNTRSRAAIERLGATFEGVLRNHRAAQGELGAPGGRAGPRDSAMYSVTDTEWPSVAAGIEGLLERHGHPEHHH